MKYFMVQLYFIMTAHNTLQSQQNNINGVRNNKIN